jgi:hypothetical protein
MAGTTSLARTTPTTTSRHSIDSACVRLDILSHCLVDPCRKMTYITSCSNRSQPNQEPWTSLPTILPSVKPWRFFAGSGTDLATPSFPRRSRIDQSARLLPLPRPSFPRNSWKSSLANSFKTGHTEAAQISTSRTATFENRRIGRSGPFGPFRWIRG